VTYEQRHEVRINNLASQMQRTVNDLSEQDLGTLMVTLAVAAQAARSILDHELPREFDFMRTTGAAIFLGSVSLSVAAEYRLPRDTVRDILAEMVAMKTEVEAPEPHEEKR